MKKTCPECQSIIVIDETKYTPGSVVKTACQLCGTPVEFDIPSTAEKTTPPQNQSSQSGNSTKQDKQKSISPPFHDKPLLNSGLSIYV